jgi:outer membrane protein assembly factor BamB
MNSEPIPPPPGIPSMVQPQLFGGASLVIATGDGQGLARLEQTGTAAAPAWKQQWISRKLKPSYNDFVIHQDHIYGFDQNIVACVDAKSGEQRWKRGRYGFGQMLLFPESNQLLVLSEAGELVLVAAEPAAHRELAKFPVIAGKTWNHPAWADGKLYVRNGAEIACVELPLAE